MIQAELPDMAYVYSRVINRENFFNITGGLDNILSTRLEDDDKFWYFLEFPWEWKMGRKSGSELKNELSNLFSDDENLTYFQRARIFNKDMEIKIEADGERVTIVYICDEEVFDEWAWGKETLIRDESTSQEQSLSGKKEKKYTVKEQSYLMWGTPLEKKKKDDQNKKRNIKGWYEAQIPQLLHYDELGIDPKKLDKEKEERVELKIRQYDNGGTTEFVRFMAVEPCYPGKVEVK